MDIQLVFNFWQNKPKFFVLGYHIPTTHSSDCGMNPAPCIWRPSTGRLSLQVSSPRTGWPRTAHPRAPRPELENSQGQNAKCYDPSCDVELRPDLLA